MVNRSAQGRAFESLSAAILFAGCRTRGGRDGAWIDVRVGGSGGSFHALNCPAGEALYRVDARSGNAIDSLEGCCRRFPPQEVDPNAPVFDEAPAQGSTVTLSATTGGEIVLRAQGITAPVVMDLHAMSNCASRFALVAAISASRTGTAMSSRPPPPATLPGTTSISRVLRVSGPIPVNPLSEAPAVPVTLAARDAAGRTTQRTFMVYLR